MHGLKTGFFRADYPTLLLRSLATCAHLRPGDPDTIFECMIAATMKEVRQRCRACSTVVDCERWLAADELIFPENASIMCLPDVAQRVAVKTRLLMTLSAVFLALLGLATSYFPEKVLTTHGTVPDNATLLLVQMMGALYLGFAILNWTARGVLMGGIYARPLALGNFLHFAMVGAMLTRAAITHGVIQLATSAFVFSVFAIWFGVVLFRGPVRASQTND